MSATQKRIITIWLASILLSGVAYSNTEQKQVLPRSFGPLSLGMTEEEFQNITGLKTYACEGCKPHEFVAAIDIGRYPDLFPKYVYKFAAPQRGVDCGFYRNKLYKIAFPPEVKEIAAARRKYTETFGPPTKLDEWPNGLSWLTWENEKTIFSIAYVRKRGDAYPLTLPVGTVSSVYYIDKVLYNELHRQ